MRRIYIYLSIVIITTLVGTAGAYVYVLPILFPNDIQGTSPTSQSRIHLIRIPPHPAIPPPGWTYLNSSTHSTYFPVNITVTIGVNNTIEWINDDTEPHTVTSFEVPSGAVTFNSDLILQGKTFTVTLIVPGVYKYFCSWHNWL